MVKLRLRRVREVARQVRLEDKITFSKATSGETHVTVEFSLILLLQPVQAPSNCLCKFSMKTSQIPLVVGYKASVVIT